MRKNSLTVILLVAFINRFYNYFFKNKILILETVNVQVKYSAKLDFSEARAIHSKRSCYSPLICFNHFNTENSSSYCILFSNLTQCHISHLIVVLCITLATTDSCFSCSFQKSCLGCFELARVQCSSYFSDSPGCCKYMPCSAHCLFCHHSCLWPISAMCP
jgi:hypothetical protein